MGEVAGFVGGDAPAAAGSSWRSEAVDGGPGFGFEQKNSTNLGKLLFFLQLLTTAHGSDRVTALSADAGFA